MTLILVSILVVGYIECPLLSSDGVASMYHSRVLVLGARIRRKSL